MNHDIGLDKDSLDEITKAQAAEAKMCMHFFVLTSLYREICIHMQMRWYQSKGRFTENDIVIEEKVYKWEDIFIYYITDKKFIYKIHMEPNAT